jgi:hypothetical protein
VIEAVVPADALQDFEVASYEPVASRHQDLRRGTKLKIKIKETYHLVGYLYAK